MNFPKRKHPRLKEYDYSENGCYFVTVCVKERRNLLCSINVGRDAHIPPQVVLTDIGGTVAHYIGNINSVYDNVVVDKYCIMPNHIHLLISINDNGGMRASRPTLHTIIRSMKTMVTKELGYSIWQTSYYDRIIRNQREYEEIFAYIDGNPAGWEKDEFYK